MARKRTMADLHDRAAERLAVDQRKFDRLLAVRLQDAADAILHRSLRVVNQSQISRAGLTASTVAGHRFMKSVDTYLSDLSDDLVDRIKGYRRSHYESAFGRFRDVYAPIVANTRPISARRTSAAGNILVEGLTVRQHVKRSSKALSQSMSVELVKTLRQIDSLLIAKQLAEERIERRLTVFTGGVVSLWLDSASMIRNQAAIDVVPVESLPENLR